MDKKYNGFANYETWCVNLYLNNDRRRYCHWRDAAKQAAKEGPASQRVQQGDCSPYDAAVRILADQLHERVEILVRCQSSDFCTDLLLAVLEVIDWQEIASDFLEDCWPPDETSEPGEPQATDAPPSESAPPNPHDARPTESPSESSGEAVGFWRPEDVIDVYTRAQAIGDGVLVDAESLAANAGFRYPVALTSAAWETCVAVPMSDLFHNEQDRLWEMLNVLRVAIKTTDGHNSRIDFSVDVADEDEMITTVRLKSLCGPGDNGEPVITVMLPHED